jgi:hypothetical protein
MPRLDINVPFETDQAVIVVEVDPANPLQRGKHKFQLEVIDDSNNVSLPAEFVIHLADQERPNAVLEGPEIVSIGKSFELRGNKSFDLGGGQIKTYRFTYLGPQL